MHRLPVAMSEAFATTGTRGRVGAWVEGVMLFGTTVDAHVMIDIAEHRRRRMVGVASVPNPIVLDRLLNLPADILVRDPCTWAEMVDQAPGIIERSSDGAGVTRLLRRPLTIEDVVVTAAAKREFRAVQKASWFAGFTRRWIATTRDSLPDTVHLEATLCGVGILGPEHQLILPADPPTSSLIDKWSWLLQEKAYRRWLSQLPPTEEASSAGKC